MKRKILIIICCMSVSCICFATWFDKVTDTVNTVDSIVNSKPAVKLSISELLSSDTKYINKVVQVSGKVVGLAVDTKGKFVVIIEAGGRKLKLYTDINPNCRLLDKITAIGMYNGYGIEQTRISLN